MLAETLEATGRTKPAFTWANVSKRPACSRERTAIRAVSSRKPCGSRLQKAPECAHKCLGILTYRKWGYLLTLRLPGALETISVPQVYPRSSRLRNLRLFPKPSGAEIPAVSGNKSIALFSIFTLVYAGLIGKDIGSIGKSEAEKVDGLCTLLCIIIHSTLEIMCLPAIIPGARCACRSAPLRRRPFLLTFLSFLPLSFFLSLSWVSMFSLYNERPARRRAN